MVKGAVKSKPQPKKVKLPPKPDNTRKDHAIERPKSEKAQHLVKTQWQPGVSPNPAGRPKGSRNKLAESFVADVLRDWEQAGASAIQRVRIEDPSTYLRVVASLVPKEFSLAPNREQSLDKFLEQLTDEQYEEYKRAVAAILAIPVGGNGQKT